MEEFDPEQLEHVFDTLDVDRNGYLTLNEVLAPVKCIAEYDIDWTAINNSDPMTDVQLFYKPFVTKLVVPCDTK